MILVALVALYVILFLMDGRSARRNKRNREMIVSIRATVPDYPGRHRL